MRLLPIVALALATATPALAEPVSGAGYLVGCATEEGPAQCTIVFGGFNLSVLGDGGTPEALFAQLVALKPISAVTFEGTLSDMGDSSATLVLSAVAARADDLYEGNLRAMQGRWTPAGEETPFEVQISGLDWVELQMDEVLDSFLMTVAEACGSGILPGNGMAITLYRYGDDPGDDACWRLEYIDDKTMELRDFKGDHGAVTFTRVID